MPAAEVQEDGLSFLQQERGALRRSCSGPVAIPHWRWLRRRRRVERGLARRCTLYRQRIHGSSASHYRRGTLAKWGTFDETDAQREANLLSAVVVNLIE